MAACKRQGADRVPRLVVYTVVYWVAYTVAL